MTLQQAMEKNPYDCNKGNLSAYARYIRYNVDGMYSMKSKEVQNLIIKSLISEEKNKTIDEVVEQLKHCYGIVRSKSVDYA